MSVTSPIQRPTYSSPNSCSGVPLACAAPARFLREIDEFGRNLETLFDADAREYDHLEEAHRQADRGVAGLMEGHAAMDMSVQAEGTLWQRLLSPAGFTARCRALTGLAGTRN